MINTKHMIWYQQDDMTSHLVGCKHGTSCDNLIPTIEIARVFCVTCISRLRRGTRRLNEYWRGMRMIR